MLITHNVQASATCVLCLVCPAWKDLAARGACAKDKLHLVCRVHVRYMQQWVFAVCWRAYVHMCVPLPESEPEWLVKV